MTSAAMIETYPGEVEADHQRLSSALDALIACAQTCTACADACLAEQQPADLRACIRLNLDCADICGATARVFSRHTAGDPTTVRALLQACVQACRSCAEECERHADHHEHCRVCAQQCRSCEEACSALLATLA
ncbi:four-helix bundle copper-binding protein [Georgenia deserti]|uniref:Four-helix bundle copper-binding protein n=1 Tax=Georgenia deserti TaxID=2093781 RepID=A0ABW4L4D3_9MICO